MAKVDKSRVEAVAEQIASLTAQEVEQLRQVMLRKAPGLLERIWIRLLFRREAPQEPGHDIMELEGLGEDFWRSINVEEYLRRERNAWG